MTKVARSRSYFRITKTVRFRLISIGKTYCGICSIGKNRNLEYLFVYYLEIGKVILTSCLLLNLSIDFAGSKIFRPAWPEYACIY